MGKNRVFLLKHRILTVFRCLSDKPAMSYRPLDSPSPPKHASKFLKCTRNLRSKVKSIICCGGGSKNNMVLSTHRPTDCKYMQTGDEEVVPKGYMPVYVGQEDGSNGDFERVLVPVVYFNDPLFGQLLRDAEEEFGFDHPGAITLPCRISEFEHVQTRIKERNGARKILRWK